MDPTPAESTAAPKPASAMQRLATAVLEARTQRLMSRVALAEQAGLSLQVVEDLERGFPIAHEAAAALCRNLDLPVPPLDTDPQILLALLVRQRRGLARLSRAELAARCGLTPKMIHSIESASLWPSQAICRALLSVKALHLQAADVAAFLPVARAPDAGSVAAPPADAATAPAEPANERQAPPGPPSRRRGRPPATTSAAPASAPHALLDTKAVATFLVRFYANGKVSIEMRPNLPKPRRDASPK